MNRWIVALTLVFSFAATPVFAGSSTTIPMQAGVDEQLTLNATVYEGNVGGAKVMSMNFGSLVADVANGPLRANKFFTVYMTANTSARRYEIKQTASALSNSSGATLVAGACITTPHSNGITLPTESQLGTQGSFVAIDKLVYRSEPAGSAQSVAAVFAITNDPTFGATQFIPSDQQGGTYASSVTFTLTLI